MVGVGVAVAAVVEIASGDESTTIGAATVELVDAVEVVVVAVAAGTVAGLVLAAAGACRAGLAASSAAAEAATAAATAEVGDVVLGAIVGTAPAAVVGAVLATEVGSLAAAARFAAAVGWFAVAWGWVAAVVWLGGVDPRAIVATATAIPAAAATDPYTVAFVGDRPCRASLLPTRVATPALPAGTPALPTAPAAAPALPAVTPAFPTAPAAAPAPAPATVGRNHAPPPSTIPNSAGPSSSGSRVFASVSASIRARQSSQPSQCSSTFLVRRADAVARTSVGICFQYCSHSSFAGTPGWDSRKAWRSRSRARVSTTAVVPMT